MKTVANKMNRVKSNIATWYKIDSNITNRVYYGSQEPIGSIIAFHHRLIAQGLIADIFS